MANCIRAPSTFAISSLLAMVFLSACVSYRGAPNLPNDVELTAEEKEPFHQINVGDADEAAILAQKFNLDIFGRNGNTIYFRAVQDALLELAALGYAPDRGEPNSVHARIVRVWKDGRPETALGAYDIRVINDEGAYWIVSGAIGAVRALSAAGFRITRVEDGEPRPRAVVVFVDQIEDVQRLNRLGMDIHSVGNLPEQRGNAAAPSLNDYATDASRFFRVTGEERDRIARKRLIDEYGFPEDKIWIAGAVFDFQYREIEDLPGYGIRRMP